MRGVLWSHLLASVCGGLVVAGVLLAFGVIGKQHTETVPIDYSAPPTTSGGSAQTSDTETLYQAKSPGVVYIKAAVNQHVVSPFIAGTESAQTTSTGSGFLVASKAGKGYILTSFHVIEGTNYSNGITVEFNAETSRRAKVVEFSQPNDVAVLEVSMTGVSAQIHPLSLGNSRAVSVGDSTLAIANPFGLQRTVTSGIVASLQPQLVGIGGSIENVIETDASASPGASGGPLLDATTGEVIGVNSQIEVNSGGTDYLVDFAVPINTAAKLIPSGVL